MLVGFPSFLVAMLLNVFFVSNLQWNVPLSYAIVITMQVIINFFLCKKFVFENNSKKTLKVQFMMFVSGIAVFRLLDWVLYSILVEIVCLYFLYIQIFNILFFSVLKFFYSKTVFEK